MNRAILAMATLLVAGCPPPPYASDEGTLSLDASLTTTTRWSAFTTGDAILAGSRTCRWEVGTIGLSLPDTVPACYVTAREGFSGDPRCLAFDAPGAATWTFEPEPPCAEAGAVPDRFAFEVLPADDVTAELDRWTEEAIADLLPEPDFTWLGAREPTWGPAPGAPVRILAGEPVAFDVRLVGPGGQPVAFAPEDARWTVDVGRVTVVDRRPSLTLGAGEQATLTLALPAGTFEVGTFLGTGPEDVVDVVVNAALLAPEEGDEAIVARALGATADGEPVEGLPVTWGLRDGAMAFEPGLYAGRADHTWVHDACLPPERQGGRRAITVVARWEGRVGRIDLSWVDAGGEPDPAWAPHPDCVGVACGCATGAGPASAWAAALLGLVALGRRGRPVTPDRGAPPSPA